jgi:hypothetical protein
VPARRTHEVGPGQANGEGSSRRFAAGAARVVVNGQGNVRSSMDMSVGQIRTVAPISDSSLRSQL